MRTRGEWRARGAACGAALAALTLGGVARAQLLDLPGGASGIADPGPGIGVLGLVDRLREEADELDAKKGDVPAGARAAIRRAAAELMARGDGAGAAGSATVLLGRTLAARLEDWDRLLGEEGSIPEPVAALLAHDLNGAVASGALIVSPETTLRDAMADLVAGAGQPAGMFGWVEAEPVPRDLGSQFTKEVEAWGTVPGVSPETIGAIRGLAATLAEADGWVAYRRSGARVRLLLMEGAGVLREVEWIDDVARRALAEEFDRGAAEFADSGTRGSGSARLERLALIAGLIRETERLDASGPGAGVGAVRRVRAAVVQAATRAAGDPSAERRVAENSRRVLGLALARQDLPAESALVRQARPAWRHLLAAARRDEPQMLAALPDILRRPDAMTDPGIVAAVGRMQRTIDDLRGLAALCATMADGGAGEGREPVVANDWEPVGARVLELGQRMARGDEPERMVQHLRTFADRVSRLMRLPGEARLDAALAAGGDEREVWDALTGSKAADLPPDFADRRRVWIRGWTQGKDDTEASEIARLENLRLLMGTLDDVTRVEAVLREARDTGEPMPRAYRPLQCWPGWEMSIEALTVLREGLVARLGDGVVLVLGPEQERAAKELEAIRVEFAAVRLCGRLLGLAEARGLGDAGAPYEVVTGGPYESGPGASWLGEHRAAIADVCRYAEEIGPAVSLGDRERVGRLRAFVNARAVEVLGAIAGGV